MILVSSVLSFWAKLSVLAFSLSLQDILLFVIASDCLGKLHTGFDHKTTTRRCYRELVKPLTAKELAQKVASAGLIFVASALAVGFYAFAPVLLLLEEVSACALYPCIFRCGALQQPY